MGKHENESIECSLSAIHIKGKKKQFMYNEE